MHQGLHETGVLRYFNTVDHLVVLSAAGNSPLCFSIQANVKRVTVSSIGMFTTSLVSQSK